MESTVLGWIESYGSSALLLVPTLAFAEACIGLGLFVSGAFLLALATVLYSNDVASLEWIAALALLGAYLGDHAGFYIGFLFGPRINESKFANKYQHRLVRAEELVRKYGSLAIFIGRFVPAIRSIIPALLGISGFSRRAYSLLDFCACLLWSLALAALVLGIELAF